MLFTVLAYVAAVVLLPAVSTVFSLPFMILAKSLRGNPVAVIIANAAGIVLAVLLFRWLCGLVDVEVAYAMIAIPAFLTYRNNSKRLTLAKLGTSFTGTVETGPGYTKEGAISLEKAYAIGDLIGYVASFILITPTSLF